MMKMVVLVKQVPDTTEVRIDPRTNTLVREGVESILNPYDQFALEQAVRLKEKVEGSTITVISMGPPQARKALLKSLALGADRAILLSDRAFAGSDTWATSVALSHAIRHLDGFDIIFCGLQAIDGDTAQVGPETAQLLEIPQITYAESVERIDGIFRVVQQTEEGTRILETETPLLVTCIPTPSYIPRIPPLPGIVRATDSPLEVWNAERIGADTDDTGLDGSPTQVARTYSPPQRGEVEMLGWDPDITASRLVSNLIQRKIVRKEVE